MSSLRVLRNCAGSKIGGAILFLASENLRSISSSLPSNMRRLRVRIAYSLSAASRRIPRPTISSKRTSNVQKLESEANPPTPLAQRRVPNSRDWHGLRPRVFIVKTCLRDEIS